MGTLDFIATGFISAAFIFHNYGLCRGLLDLLSLTGIWCHSSFNTGLSTGQPH